MEIMEWVFLCMSKERRAEKRGLISAPGGGLAGVWAKRWRDEDGVQEGKDEAR